MQSVQKHRKAPPNHGFTELPRSAPLHTPCIPCTPLSNVKALSNHGFARLLLTLSQDSKYSRIALSKAKAPQKHVLILTLGVCHFTLLPSPDVWQVCRCAECAECAEAQKLRRNTF